MTPAPRTIRPIGPEDAERLVAFHEALDAESQYRRFFTSHPHLTDEEVQRFTHVDHDRREALIVVEGERIVAVGRYDRLDDEAGAAEVAFVTALDHRHEGLATELLHRLADHARARGVGTLLGETLGTNTAMRRVFAHAGYPVTSTFTDGIAETRMLIGPERADLGPCAGAATTAEARST